MSPTATQPLSRNEILNTIFYLRRVVAKGVHEERELYALVRKLEQLLP